MFATCSLPLVEPELHERLLAEFAQGLTHIFPSQHQLQLQDQLQHLEEDLIAWGQHYLPHYFQQPPSAMHIEIAALLDASAGGKKGEGEHGRKGENHSTLSTEISPSPMLPFSPSSSQQSAREFYAVHRPEMESGSALLWPEHEDLYTLMSMRAASGPAVFEREKQCIPMNPEECEWPASYFSGDIWFSQWPKDLRLKTIALDPSKGTDAKHGDYSAFVMLGVANDNTIYLEANLARRPTPQIVTDGVELIKHFRPNGFGVEANQFQSLLAAEFTAEFNRQGLVTRNPYMLTNLVAKPIRIRSLGPLLAAKRFKFKSGSPGTKMLLDQLQEFPLSAHDDAPDALEMALRLAENLSHPVPNDGLGSRLI